MLSLRNGRRNLEFLSHASPQPAAKSKSSDSSCLGAIHPTTDPCRPTTQLRAQHCHPSPVISSPGGTAPRVPVQSPPPARPPELCHKSPEGAHQSRPRPRPGAELNQSVG
ncbi:hypothetical protein CALVIDRAFT_344931 [Calocera viscosa TUFC12733]|uniref:Uncharacterized protein n=1 Tax=Calocera viscosa (strain TUFC12733) TaxID=1330018 RepID=A0A167HDS6_CALVF|nr:hypothetical protein CALVIDRAFT_344931 [Calocera viscosa TUFC12733]